MKEKRRDGRERKRKRREEGGRSEEKKRKEPSSFPGPSTDHVSPVEYTAYSQVGRYKDYGGEVIRCFVYWNKTDWLNPGR